MTSTATESIIHDLSNPMKTSSLRSFATFAALRFNFFSLASRAAGDKWAGPAVQPYHFSAKLLRDLRASAFRFIQHSKSNIQNSSPSRSFATLAALRFNLFTSASRAVGDKWAGYGWPALPVFLLLALPAAASTTWNGPTWSVSTAIPDNNDLGYWPTTGHLRPRPHGNPEHHRGPQLHRRLEWRSLRLPRPRQRLFRPPQPPGPHEWQSRRLWFLGHDHRARRYRPFRRPHRDAQHRHRHRHLSTRRPHHRSAARHRHLARAAPSSAASPASIPTAPGPSSSPTKAPARHSTLQSWTLNITAVPEPGTCTLLGLGLGAWLIRRKRGPRMDGAI